MRKKILTLLLVMVMLLGVVILASCGGGDDGRPSYKITFNLAGGTTDEDLSNVTVKKGDKLWQPKDPVKEGATFLGWYNGSSKWDFENDKVTKKITLDAWWSGGQQTITCDHDYQLVKEVAVTCTTAGWKQYKCSICKNPMKETFDPIGHDFHETVTPPTCALQGYTETKCNNCGISTKNNYVNATGKHEWSDYEVVYEATVYTAGLEKRYCQVCEQTLTYTLDPLYEQSDLKDLVIDNYLYTGGKYTNEPFVNISGFGGTEASSFYTVANSAFAIDRDPSTYWQADTLVDGTSYVGEYLIVKFNNAFDIGKVDLIIPSYSSWQINDNYYVTYDIEALKDGEWVKIGEIDDRDAHANAGEYVTLSCVFSEPVNTDAIRAVVTHGSRFTPAKIHEIQVFAKTDKIYRLPSAFGSSTVASVGGKWNEYATGASALIDGVMSTGWQTDAKNHLNEEIKAYATLEFSSSQLVTSIQFATAQSKGRAFRLLYGNDAGEWVVIGEYTVPTRSDDNCQLCTVDGQKVALFTIDGFNDGKGIRTTKLMLQIIEEPVYWESFVYSFDPITVVEEAYKLDGYAGCQHTSLRTDRDPSTVKVDPTCTTAGYTTVQCKCGEYSVITNRVSATGHTWGDFEVTAVATETTMGTQTAECACGATRTRTYGESYAPAIVTKYFHNAPAAWAQGLDDGNYLPTYTWFAPVLKEYKERNNGFGYIATTLMTINMMDQYVEIWQEHFATGVFDLGSHTRTHSGSYSSNEISESSYLSDINSAHYWFMSRFRGQQLLSFATPNGATSGGTALYINGLMQCGRNGGDRTYLNLVEDYSHEVDWGNMNAYQSKINQTEGLYFFVKDGKFYSAGGALGALNLDGSFGKVVIDYNKTNNEPDPNKPKYGGWLEEWIEGAKTDASGQIPVLKDPDNPDDDLAVDNGENRDYSGEYVVLNTFAGYKSFKISELEELVVQNYVYSEETNKLELYEGEGTYYYDAENYRFEWKESGSYVEQGGQMVYNPDKNDGYKLYHVELGSYEKAIDDLIEKGGFTLECLHAIMPDPMASYGYIHVTYVSTISKLEYLYKTGVWTDSYNNVTKYLREAHASTVETTSYEGNTIKLSLTDTLDDIMYNHALTIQVDIPDTWSDISATQNGEAVYYFIKDGFAYVDAVPDRGEIVITMTAGE